VGRKKQFPVRIVLPLPEGTVERIDAILTKGEARLDVIREAIERELKRRERDKPKD
jgi:metal-responsive CopG/Arc/MetJ family transcriptional regulator